MRIILFSLLFISQIALAAPAPTIYDGSVNWDDIAARTALLNTAKTPQWDSRAMNTVYDVYAHPKQHQLPKINNEQKYNTEFLDAYWGPLTNPFVKYERPAKVFAYVGEQKDAKSFMAPIVQSAADGNFYIFNKKSSRPQLLEEWVNEIKSKTQYVSVKINICNGYGNLPKDTCEGKSYQAEANFAISSAASMIMPKASMNASPSAMRGEDEDWRVHLDKAKTFGATFAKPSEGTIADNSIAWNDKKQRDKLLFTTAEWPSYRVIQNNFEKLRDLRYFNDTQKNSFMRRISWLYPDDGCWTRASAVINHLFGATNNSINKFERPSKIFAFGNLCANTSNNRAGKVHWWYHTAPLIRDAVTEKVYVLDPSIDPRKPMLVEDWMSAIAANTGACKRFKAKVDKFNVCNGFAANPHDVCSKENFINEAEQALRQNQYQQYERSRQVELGRDADKVLGDEAPWM